MNRSNLLFVSPIMPALTGKGFAMRAGMVLEALAEDHNVFLTVIPVYGEPASDHPPAPVSRWCADIAVHRPATRAAELFGKIPRKQASRELAAAVPRAVVNGHQVGTAPTPRPYVPAPQPLLYSDTNSGKVRGISQPFKEVPFQIVHVFRLYMAPFVQSYLHAVPQRRPLCFLDLDDYESKTRRRLAALYEARGERTAAAFERSESLRFGRMERCYLPLFDQVYVSSPQDRTEIRRRHGSGNVSVVPNAVRMPTSRPAKTSNEAFTLLFVGSMDHYPNEDAMLFFCAEILPHLRRRARRPFRIVIVGSRPSPRILALAAHPEVTIVGDAADVGTYYGDADMVAVPLRAGGGTRIKILEAASYRRPVVSTPIGAEGLKVSHAKELLFAETPREFAESCLRLMNEPSRGRKLAERAYDWVKSHHTLEHVQASLRQHCPSGKQRAAAAWG